MYDQFVYILAFALFGIAFVVANVAIISRIIRPKVRDPAKETIYECGEPTIGTSWVRFDIRFYTVAIIFLLFEVEVAFLFPWAAVFRPLSGRGVPAAEIPPGARPILGLPFVFVEAAIFIAILFVGLAYVWAKGDLEWVKATEANPKAARRVPDLAMPSATAPPVPAPIGGERA